MAASTLDAFLAASTFDAFFASQSDADVVNHYEWLTERIRVNQGTPNAWRRNFPGDVRLEQRACDLERELSEWSRQLLLFQAEISNRGLYRDWNDGARWKNKDGDIVVGITDWRCL